MMPVLVERVEPIGVVRRALSPLAQLVGDDPRVGGAGLVAIPVNPPAAAGAALGNSLLCGFAFVF